MAYQPTDFNLTEERAEFRDTLRRFFEEHAPITEVRRVMEAGEGVSKSLWQRASEELGLAGLAIDEAHGGQGFGLEELALALGEVGRCLAPVPLFGSAALAGRVVAAVAGTDEAERWLRPIAEGQIASLAWVESGCGWDPAEVGLVATPEGSGFRLSGQKQLVLDAQHAARFFVIARSPGSTGADGLGLFAVEAASPGVSVEARESFDPTRPLATLVLENVEAVSVGAANPVEERIRAGLEEATVLLCAEMAGGMQKVLETAVDYAAERHQFSRPIGSFQAIKHKCADLLIDFEGGRTASAGALTAWVDGDPERSILTAVAKSHVGPCYVRMTTESMQIQGGVGYTWEYDAHLYYRRAVSGAQMLGDAALHQERLARWVADGLQEMPSAAGAAQS